ncbi:MAG TPA: aldehyde dehydrogenase [Rhodocyclaceae bacterium]|nr:aldehyde dehydrogenase [Rhodocyclaceae bacterium]
MNPSAINWIARAAEFRPDGHALINGERVAALNGATFDCLSPIHGQKLADVARCGEADVDRAVAAARAAFADRRWAGLAPRQRKEIMIRWAELIMVNGDTLALAESLDMGKPVAAALLTDVNAAARTIRWYGEAIDKVYDEIAPTGDDALALVTREPVGVVGAIVPWNYPMLMAAWKLAPALAVGNSVVLKPSEKSPLSALILGDLALQAGIPRGVLNVLPGFGPEAGAALALHLDVDCIAFTGSTKVGQAIHEMAARSNLKRAWCELGGKSPNIVFDDCPNLDDAVASAVGSTFYNQGESCNCPSRLLLQRSIHDRFVEKLLARVPRHTPGNPLDPNTRMGALVDEAQMRTVLRYIEAGKHEGAQLIAGGERVFPVASGYYVAPTVFDGVDNAMTIAREEIFGPVLSIITFDTAEEAIRIANTSQYGLQAGVWTSDLNKAHRTARALRAGTVHVNSYDEDDITVPFGGYKQSGNGRDKSLHAIDKYCELKTTWIKLK